MLDYDEEAADYDRTRGGSARARAAALALDRLLPARSVILDLAVGTGIVAAELESLGHKVIGIDLSSGMLARAAHRLPGRVARAAAETLPLPDDSVDAVTAIWLLHLLDEAGPVVAEVARVLRPDGRFLTTVDKFAAHRAAAGSAEVRSSADGCARLTAVGARHDLHLTTATSFVGHGQAQSGGVEPHYPVLGFQLRGENRTM